jgi:Txe/YoeB family toxin of Txe-Axe toxin-antitoxin module/TPR repeat protein
MMPMKRIVLASFLSFVTLIASIGLPHMSYAGPKPLPPLVSIPDVDTLLRQGKKFASQGVKQQQKALDPLYKAVAHYSSPEAMEVLGNLCETQKNYLQAINWYALAFHRFGLKAFFPEAKRCILSFGKVHAVAGSLEEMEKVKFNSLYKVPGGYHIPNMTDPRSLIMVWGHYASGFLGSHLPPLTTSSAPSQYACVLVGDILRDPQLQNPQNRMVLARLYDSKQIGNHLTDNQRYKAQKELLEGVDDAEAYFMLAKIYTQEHNLSSGHQPFLKIRDLLLKASEKGSNQSKVAWIELVTTPSFDKSPYDFLMAERFLADIKANPVLLEKYRAKIEEEFGWDWQILNYLAFRVPILLNSSSIDEDAPAATHILASYRQHLLKHFFLKRKMEFERKFEGQEWKRPLPERRSSKFIKALEDYLCSPTADTDYLETLYSSACAEYEKHQDPEVLLFITMLHLADGPRQDFSEALKLLHSIAHKNLEAALYYRWLAEDIESQVAPDVELSYIESASKQVDTPVLDNSITLPEHEPLVSHEEQVSHSLQHQEPLPGHAAGPEASSLIELPQKHPTYKALQKQLRKLSPEFLQRKREYNRFMKRELAKIHEDEELTSAAPMEPKYTFVIEDAARSSIKDLLLAGKIEDQKLQETLDELQNLPFGLQTGHPHMLEGKWKGWWARDIKGTKNYRVIYKIDGFRIIIGSIEDYHRG